MSGASSWAALAVACGLMLLAGRWTRRLPGSRSRVLAGIERIHDARQRWIDRVGDTLDAAQLYASAGRSGAGALDAAAAGRLRDGRDLVGEPTHPLQRVLPAPQPATAGRADGPSLAALVAEARRSDTTTAVEALRRCSDHVSERHADAMRRSRLMLLRARILGPSLLCSVPATALVIAALSA